MKNERINVGLKKETHTTTSQIASLLGKTLIEAIEEAAQDWNQKHALAAQKRATRLLQAQVLKAAT